MRKIAILPLFILAAILAIGVVALQQSFTSHGETFAVPATGPTKQVFAQENTEVHSGDGTKKIIMRVTDGTGSKTYSFSTSNIDGTNEIHLASFPVLDDTRFVIPQNSWSPDNKYVFVKETTTAGFDFLAFKGSGELFASGEKYLSVVPLFQKSQPNLVLRDVTGWDADTLLNVLSTKSDGSVGSKFWFDVTSRAFIELWR